MSGERLVWYIDTCSISDPDNNLYLNIIENACYSDLVYAENQNLPYTKMLVDDKSKFKWIIEFVPYFHLQEMMKLW